MCEVLGVTSVPARGAGRVHPSSTEGPALTHVMESGPVSLCATFCLQVHHWEERGNQEEARNRDSNLHQHSQAWSGRRNW